MKAVRKRHLKLGVVAVASLSLGMLISPAAVQAAVNYFDTTRIVNGTGTAYCPSGWRVTGGGFYPLPAGYDYFHSSSAEYVVTGSYPYSATSWRVTGKGIYGTYNAATDSRTYRTASYSPKAYAVCAS